MSTLTFGLTATSAIMLLSHDVLAWHHHWHGIKGVSFFICLHAIRQSICINKTSTYWHKFCWIITTSIQIVQDGFQHEALSHWSLASLVWYYTQLQVPLNLFNHSLPTGSFTDIFIWPAGTFLFSVLFLLWLDTP